MDYILLPSYVGYDNAHYLTDVRGNYLQKAKYPVLAKFTGQEKTNQIKITRL